MYDHRDDVCTHNIYIRGLCGNCGIRIDPPQSSSVSMVHSVPELKVSREKARQIGFEDQERLISQRKLVLLVDLDHTILHTTHERVENDPNVHQFALPHSRQMNYTKLRPNLDTFLEEVAKLYELHIITFGCKSYGDKIASIIDPEKKYFGNRILTRDESVDQTSKFGNLNNLFPCGDNMVCIIDDNAEVWRDARTRTHQANLIRVKPYVYFRSSISDGCPKQEDPDKEADSEEDSKDAEYLEALLDEGDDDNDNINEGDANKIDNLDKDGNDNDNQKRYHNDDDDNDYLVDLLHVLSNIHDAWYKELDDEKKYLQEDEKYKLPDIKDIIRRERLKSVNF